MPSLLLIGDSHTVGPFGQTLERLFRDEGWEVETHAIIGRSTSQWADELARKPIPGRFDLAVVALGSNDSGHTDDQETAAASTVMGSVTSRSVAWVGPPCMSVDVSRQAGALRKAVEGNGWTWIDSERMTRGLQRYADGVHYLPSSGAHWARQVKEVLPSTSPALPLVLGAVSAFSALGAHRAGRGEVRSILVGVSVVSGVAALIAAFRS